MFTRKKHLHHLHLQLVDVELQNGLQMQLVMMKIIMLLVTGMMELVVGTTLTKLFVHFVNALALSPQIPLPLHHLHLHYFHLLLMDVELRNGLQIMAIRVVEFSNGGYKIRKIFA